MANDGRRAVGSTESSLASSIAFRALVFFVTIFVAVQIFVVWDFQSRDGAYPSHLDPLLGGDENGEPQEGADAGLRGNRTVIPQVNIAEAEMDVPALLRQAGVSVDAATLSKLPAPSQIASMYGRGPVVLGTDSCVAFRSAVRPEDRHAAPAGLFNTGTNNLATLLRRNCYIPEREGALEDWWKSGMRFQVPWGKHNPVGWRFRNVAAQGGRGIVQKDVLPVVVVRDPISWMVSMCRHPYGVRLHRNCVDGGFASSVDPVAVPYKPQNVTRYDSLVDLWHRWYDDWMTVAHRDQIPAVFVRFEDLLFHPDAVVQQVCDCVGGKRRESLYLREETAKGEIGPHAGGSGLLDAIIKNGDAKKRQSTLQSKQDRDHVREDRFSYLLARFHYSVEGIR